MLNDKAETPSLYT